MTITPPSGGRGEDDQVPGGATPGGGPPADETLFSQADAARYVRISATTLRRWAVSGRVRGTATAGGGMRFAKADLDAAGLGRPPGSRGAPGNTPG